MFHASRSSHRLAALLLAGALSFANAAAAQNFGPAAIVNDVIITNYDVEERARLAVVASGGGSVDSMRQRALNSLIDDALKTQAAKRAGIKLTDAQLEAGLAEIAARNGVSPDQMVAHFQSRGVSRDALLAQVRAEVSWRDLILRRYGARATVDEVEVETELANVDRAVGGIEYAILEMVFPFSDGGEANARAQAESVVRRLRGGESFTELARQYSKAVSAARGGDRGWLSLETLDPALRDVAAGMSPNQVSDPVRTATGYTVIGLRDVRVAGTAQPLRYDLKQIVIAAQRNVPQSVADQALAQANMVYNQATDCASMDALKGRYPGASGDITGMTLAEMPGPVRAAVAPLRVGQKAQPIRSNDGFHVIMVCDISGGEAAAQPSRDQLRDALLDKKLARYSRNLLQELRRSAVIDRR